MHPLPVMIGQFFSSRKGTGGPPVPSTTGLDSATEESHTRYLLYPDSNTLYQGDGQPYPLHGPPLTPATTHDGPLPEIDLEYPRDCRIIIAQDETPAMPKTILFDSKPAPPRADSPTLPPSLRARSSVANPPNAPTACSSSSTTTTTTTTTTPMFGGLHARRSSLATEPTSPRSPTVGGFTRIRARGSSISSMPNIDEHAQVQAKAQARAKESTDLANICLDCMFGNLAMNYRGNSNKIHIVPLDAKPADSPVLASSVDATSSLGRAEGLRRRSNLAKSFTPANMPLGGPSRLQSSEGMLKEPKRRTIFITRMFSVTLAEDDDYVRTPVAAPSSLPKASGFPFPSSASKPATGKFPYPAHVRKSPMYAIAIILHLPISHTPPPLRPSSRGGVSKNAPHISMSVPGHDSLGSSLDSERRAGWAFIDSNLGVESLLSSSLSSDVDDRVDVVGQHWDVIMRALTSLQHIVQERILAHFKLPDAASPPPVLHQRQQSSRSSLRDNPCLQTTRKSLRLAPNALMVDKEIQVAAERTGNRVVTGMRLPRVTTGQGKWGLWREEARWLGRWAGRKEQNFFFFNLLTAFLGSHTEWLNLVGPKWARRRHREQQKAKAGDNLTIPNRTIIVSPDKMAARRLIFLLAAFLPSNTGIVGETSASMRPGTSTSLRAYSQSPPTNMPPSRKHSLRRQINRRPKDKKSMTSMMLPPLSAGGIPQISADTFTCEQGQPEMTEPAGTYQSLENSRRSSAHSIRTSLVMPCMSSDGPIAAKTSVATISTAPPQSTIPMAHFTVPRTKPLGSTAPDHRPESRDSLASANLIHTLQRSGTGQTSIASNDSSNTSRWSGFMNFWSGRRTSSTDQSDYLQTTDDGIAFRRPQRSQSQLENMVQELSMDGVFGDGDAYDTRIPDPHPIAETSPNLYPVGGSSGIPASAARPIPERAKTFDSELRLSVNEKDGVIDVDISLPEFGSPLQSPLLGGYGSASSQHGSSFGEASVLSMPYCETEQPVNAAGWLSQFHPDFAVQAIKPYRELERDIKRAMSAEPTPLNSATAPSLDSGPLERWVDVCSALIADTSTFSIKRVQLRRLVKLIPTPTYQPSAMTPGISGMPPGRSQYGNPYTASSVRSMMSEVHLAEKFIEEAIMDFDATLVDGIDRVLAHSDEATHVNSAQSSQSSSRRGRCEARADSDTCHQAEMAQTDCKSVIFDALEAVVRDVTAERNTKEDIKSDVDEKSARTVHSKTETDSSLKEGIRRWLVEVQ